MRGDDAAFDVDGRVPLRRAHGGRRRCTPRRRARVTAFSPPQLRGLRHRPTRPARSTSPETNPERRRPRASTTRRSTTDGRLSRRCSSACRRMAAPEQVVVRDRGRGPDAPDRRAARGRAGPPGRVLPRASSGPRSASSRAGGERARRGGRHRPVGRARARARSVKVELVSRNVDRAPSRSRRRARAPDARELVDEVVGTCDVRTTGGAAAATRRRPSPATTSCAPRRRTRGATTSARARASTASTIAPTRPRRARRLGRPGTAGAEARDRQEASTRSATSRASSSAAPSRRPTRWSPSSAAGVLCERRSCVLQGPMPVVEVPIAAEYFPERVRRRAPGARAGRSAPPDVGRGPRRARLPHWASRPSR